MNEWMMEGHLYVRVLMAATEINTRGQSWTIGCDFSKPLPGLTRAERQDVAGADAVALQVIQPHQLLDG